MKIWSKLEDDCTAISNSGLLAEWRLSEEEKIKRNWLLTKLLLLFAIIGFLKQFCSQMYRKPFAVVHQVHENELRPLF